MSPAGAIRLQTTAYGDDGDTDNPLRYWQTVAADSASEVIGSVKLRRLYEVSCVGVVYHLTVIEACRGQGVATVLLRHAVEFAAKQGISVILATILPDNEPSLRVARRCGFKAAEEFWNPQTGNDLSLYVKIHRKD